MKLALCSEVFRTPIDDTIRRVAEIGFDGIEIAPFNVARDVNEVTAARRAEIARLCAACGIEVVGLHWLLVSPEGLHLTTADPEIRARSNRYLGDLLRFCADLGGKLVVLGSPRQRSIAPGVDPGEAWKWIAEGLRGAAAVAAACRVRLLIEPLSPKETNFLNTVEDAILLARAVDHPQVGWHIDVKAMSSMPDGVEGTIRRFGQGAGHFHANGPDGLGPGMSPFDLRPAFAALRECGYLGWASAEPFDYSPSSDVVARTALKAMREAAASAQTVSPR